MNAAIAVFSTALLIIIPGCQRQPVESPEFVGAENKALVRRWVEEGFNRQNLAVVDELFAAQFSVDGQIIGRDGLKRSMTRHLVGFPDLHVTIDDIIAEGNKVGIWYTAEGTHRGEFADIAATGNHVKWSGFDLLTIEHGKISQARFLSDFFGLVTQLGATLRNPQGAPG
jgi:predicted ester cyclase